MTSSKLALAVVSLAFASAGVAAPITVDSSWNNKPCVTVDGAKFCAFTNYPASTAGLIGTKDIPGVGLGAGVQGQSNNEIDFISGTNSETLVVTFTDPSAITNLQIALLFDGPEYSDFQEVARFRVVFADLTSSLFSLSTQYVNTTTTNYSWNGSGSWSSAGVVNGGAGMWANANPFDFGKGISRIDMFAAAGVCATGLRCGDQSDYVFRSLNRTNYVPEPGTLTLLGLGLAGLAFASRRRRSA